jgi:hypothetical protein
LQEDKSSDYKKDKKRNETANQGLEAWLFWNRNIPSPSTGQARNSAIFIPAGFVRLHPQLSQAETLNVFPTGGCLSFPDRARSARQTTSTMTTIGADCAVIQDGGAKPLKRDGLAENPTDFTYASKGSRRG